MSKPERTFTLKIGMRNFKTAISATLCALIYSCFDRNPTFACIGAIFGMGSDMSNSILNGGNRLFGTMIGGFIGMGLFGVYICVYPDGSMHNLMYILLFIGVILLVWLSLYFEWPGAVQPGGVVLCIILFNTPVETFVSYSLYRIFDTGIGVMISILINHLFPRHRVVWILNKLRLRNDLIENNEKK